MGKNVLVTGATGFLGGHLCEALAKRGDKIVYIQHDIRSVDKFWKLRERLGKDIVAVTGPITLPDFVERVLNDYEIATVFHLAAQTQVSTAAQNPFDTFLVNTMGTLGVLEGCRRRRTPRAVIAATDKCYGNGPIPYREDNPLIERTPYGASKVCADVIAQTYINSCGMSVAITRCGNLYGPGHMNFSTLIPGTIKRIYNGERPVVRFGGKATRDFLFIEDAVQAYLMLADSDATGAFNFSGGEPAEIIDIVRRIAELMGGKVEPIVQPGGSGEIEKQALDCRLARNMLGWMPAVPFQRGLEMTVRWYENYFKGVANASR